MERRPADLDEGAGPPRRRRGNPSSSAASSAPEVAREGVAQGTAVCAECGIPIQPEPSSAENSHPRPRGTRRICVPDPEGTTSAFQLIEVCTICCLIHDIGDYWVQIQPEIEQDTVLLFALTEVWTVLRRRLQVDLDQVIARSLRENPQP